MKKIWIIITALAASGLILALISLPFGINLNFNYDMDGIHFQDDTAKQNVIENNTQEFKDIDINMLSAHVELIPSNAYGYEIKNDTNHNIDYAIKDGKLTIEEDSKAMLPVFIFKNTLTEIKVFYPENAAFNDLKLSEASGEIKANKINAKNLNLKVTSGKTDIENANFENINASCISGNMEFSSCYANSLNIKIISGKLSATDIYTKGSSLQVTSGKAEIYFNEMGGKNIVETISGKINYVIKGKESDYNRTIRTISGNFIVNGNSTKENYSSPYSANYIDAKIASGKISVDFADN